MPNILQVEDTVKDNAATCTVHELVRSYEERSGRLTVDQCLAAHQRNVMVSGGKLFLTGSYCSVIHVT